MKSSKNFTIRKDLNLDTLENLSLELKNLAVNRLLLSRGIDYQILPLVSFHRFETLIGKLACERQTFLLAHRH